MAMSSEELLLQMNILASKTDEATNPNMPFKSNATLNKGLNPAYFTGQYTKIVNAINQLAVSDANTSNLATGVANKVNEVMLDVSSNEGSAIWEAVKGLMGQATIIEGIRDILTGKKQKELLNISADDVGKVLSVAKDENGAIVTKAIEIAGIGEAIKAEDIVYSNPDRPEFSNISDAITYILNNEGNHTGGGEGGNITSTILWENIVGKPKIPSKLVMTESQLCMQTEDENLSAVDLLTDDDIDLILAALD